MIKKLILIAIAFLLISCVDCDGDCAYESYINNYDIVTNGVWK